MQIRILTIIFFLFSTLTSYANEPKIITTTNIISSIVAMLVGDKVKIESLITNNSCPYHYNLRPSDLTKIQNANIIIYINEQFDIFSAKLSESYDKNTIKISDFKNLYLIREHNKINWHIWLDLNNIRIILKNLAATLSQYLPTLKDDINENLDIALKQLINLEQIKNQKLHRLQDVILLSNSLEYFFTNNHVKIMKLYSGNQKSLKYLSRLQKLLDESTNKCLILANDQDAIIYNELNVKAPVILSSENWLVEKIDSKTFLREYLRMINQIGRCL